MDTTTVIPKEKLKSCQRWQLDSFDLSEKTLTKDAQKQEQSIENQETEDSDNNITASPTKEKIESLYQEAKENGYKQGYDEGYKNGFQEGQNTGKMEGRQQGESEIKAELDQINTLFTNLDQHIQTIDQQIAQDLLMLAIDLTKKMITQALTIHPELILPIVQEAIHHLPSTGQHLCLFLHPEDAKIVRQYINEQQLQESWEIREDTQLEQGGCHIEAGGSKVDASVETRWRRILSAIGQKNDWIEK
ncbi:MAG: flagellar assembly protein FliH [Nitrosomonas sp.]|nr:flagellar assembly protein FliH [Nitrosomonas sp.]